MKHRTVESGSRGRQAKQHGGTLVLITVFMVALFGFAALSVDVGNVLVQRTRIQEAGDSAALASVVDWATGGTALTVAQRARSFASANGVLTNEVKTVRVGKWDDSTKTFTEQASITSSDVPAVEVTNQRAVPLYFGRVVGLSSMNPRTISVAIVGRANAAAGVLPWAVCGDYTPTKCEQLTLEFFKVGSGTGGNSCYAGPTGNSGNFGQLALGSVDGSKGNNYEDLIINGYGGVLRVGDCVYPDCGVSAGQTRSGLNTRLDGVPPYVCTETSPPPGNKRLGLVAKVKTLDVNGCSEKVCITGFYVISIDGYSNNGKEVYARFLEAFTGTEVDPSAPPILGGLNGVALVK